MKALSLLTGLILCGNLWACGKKQLGKNNGPRSAQSSKPLDTQASPSPVDSPAQQINTHQFAFHRNQDEVQISSTTKIVGKELNENNKSLKFEIYVSYPQFEGEINPAQKKFNSAVAALAHKEFDEYRRGELRPMSNAERFPRYHEDVFEHLYIDYDVPFVNERLINVRFYAATYGRGAAHDVDYFFVFNYDLEAGKQIQLSDVFKNHTRYLESISKYAADAVRRTLCREGSWGTNTFEQCLKKVIIWEEGIKPSLENFDAWSVTKDGLLFSFDPCQLTGCSGGEYYVVVPYSEINELMKPNNVVSKTAP
jgi:uncharacterized protein DUF3298